MDEQAKIERIKGELEQADAVLIGAGAGLSTSAGFAYGGERYHAFVEAYGSGRILLLELGVGGNTPGIIKYPFWRMALKNKKATYACINFGEAFAPREIAARSVCFNEDIGAVLTALLQA